jgi:hypothetical protein
MKKEGEGGWCGNDILLVLVSVKQTEFIFIDIYHLIFINTLTSGHTY